MSRYLVVTDERGLPMRVIRPSDPEKCKAIAEACLRDNDRQRLDNLPAEAQAAGVEYTFVGWFGRSASGKVAVVNQDGSYREKLRTGDSFITLKTDSN